MEAYELTDLQKEILTFAKYEYCHASLNDFMERYPHFDSEEVMNAFKWLRKNRLANSMPDDPLGSWICLTNKAYKVMGWNPL